MQLITKYDSIQYHKETKKIQKNMYMDVFHVIKNRKICSLKMKRMN